MKYAKAVAGLSTLGVLAAGAFAGGLTPTWAVNGSAYKLVPYPHARNVQTQYSTTDVYGYTFANNGGLLDQVVVTDYNPNTGTANWSGTSSVLATLPLAQLSTGDLDGDGTGGYVMFSEAGLTGNYVHVEQFTSSGMTWDINGGDGVSTGLNPDGLLAQGAKPLFARVDDLFVYTVVQGASGKIIVAIYDKTYHNQVSTYTLPAGYTVTSAFLQRRLEIAPNTGESLLMLATYCPSGISLFQINYETATGLEATNSTARLFNPPGVTGYTGLTTQTTSNGGLSPMISGIDSTGTYAYMAATSTYQVSGVTRTDGFDVIYNITGPTPIYYSYVASVRANDTLWESNCAATCTQKCNGSPVDYNIWAQTVPFFTSPTSGTISYYAWFPDVNGTEYPQQTAYPFSTQQCAAYYNSAGSGPTGSVAWYAGEDPVGKNGGGITQYLSTTSNPLAGTTSTFAQQGFGGLLDMELGGTGEVYVSLPGNPITGASLFRFDTPWSSYAP